MIIRLYNAKKDFDQLLDLCEKNNIDIPDRGAIYVAANFDGKIVGVIALKQEFFIEPFISENALAGNSLFSFMDGFISGLGCDRVRAICSEKNEELFNKVGFTTIESKKIIMEKSYG